MKEKTPKIVVTGLQQFVTEVGANYILHIQVCLKCTCTMSAKKLCTNTSTVSTFEMQVEQYIFVIRKAAHILL